MHMITGFLERVRAGVGGVAVIEGGAGLGKTRLLAEARAAARALSFRTGFGAAEPGHSPIGLAVLLEALFGGAESLVERTALGSRDRSREEPFWLLQDVQTLLERAALRQLGITEAHIAFVPILVVEEIHLNERVRRWQP